ncbi:MAG: gluconokinase [Pyrinomonadaceae bacterium]|nr:gluconokinase [Acidobacteriota bacterium]MBK7932981.1 gluconokinase [Acidobacteriota bacterium]MBP7376133.1 gluconokinase [Pyrinomonadaceae bacterium]
MKQPLILSLDIGTSSVRAAIYDSDANPIPRASVKIERSFSVTPDGGFEIDTGLAIDQVVATIDQVLEKTNKLKGEIAYVASCSFWHSLVGVDARGDHTPVVLGWADTRGRAFTSVLRKRFDETAIHNRTGARFHSSFWPAKLMWLRKEFPDAFSQAAVLMSFSDLLGFRFFDEMATSVSMASGTGIFDIRKCAWDAELIKYLKIKPAMLPTIAADDQTFKLNKKYAKRWPRLANAEWFPTIADGAADNIGSGCMTKSKAALMVGTSGAMRVAYEGQLPAKIPDGLWCYRIDRRRVILGGALSDGGNLYAWMKKNLNLPKDAEQQIATRLLGAHGLTVAPYFHGERSTLYREDAQGGINGLTAANDSIDILQAAMESVAYRFAEILKQLNSVVRVKEIVASGGALRDSPVWTRIISDVLGRELTMSSVQESSLRGAVLLALESIGRIDSIDSNQILLA